MSDTLKTSWEAQTPKNEQGQNFDQIVKNALADKRLNSSERGEILAKIEAKNQAKEKIKDETIAMLESFLTTSKWWADFEKSKKVILEKIAVNKTISQSVASTTTPSTEKVSPTTAPSTEKVSPTPNPDAEVVRANKVTVDKTTNPPTVTADGKPLDDFIKSAKWKGSSVIDGVKWVFSSKLDLSKLPEADRTAVDALQKAWVVLKVLEWKQSTYSVDMNWLFDKSEISLKNWRVNFKTDAVKNNWNDYEANWAVEETAKKLESVNKLINLSMEMKSIPELIWHRDLTQTSRAEKLETEIKVLRKELWILS